MPKHRYSYAPEIWEHCQRIARHYGLYDLALFQTVAKELTWSEGSGRWTVKTSRGDTITTRFVISSPGPITVPKLPGIPGIDDFKGHAFHTSRWDYAYTGGNSEGGLTGLRDKNVGIIGTGATAIQVIPHLAQWARTLTVFQRTPSSVAERNNRETDQAWAASLEPGWQRRRVENFHEILDGGHPEEDLVADQWTDIFRNVTGNSAERATEVLGRP